MEKGAETGGGPFGVALPLTRGSFVDTLYIFQVFFKTEPFIMVSSDLRGVWGFDYTSMFAFKFPRVLLKKVQKATFIFVLCGADAILSLVLFVIINRKQSRCYYAQKGVIIGKFVRLVRKNNIEVWCGLGPTKRGHRGVSEDGRKRFGSMC